MSNSIATTRNSIRFLGGGFLALVLGWLTCKLGAEALQRAYVSGDTPVPMTCSETAQLTMSDNRYVTLTDADPCPYSLEAKDENSPWMVVHVPVGPAYDGDYADPGSIRVIVVSNEVKNDEDFERVFSGEITGVLIDRGSFSDSIIANSNPGIDFSKCWVLRHNDVPGTAQGPIATIVFGLLIFGLGPVVLLIAAQSPTVGLADLVSGSRSLLGPIFLVTGPGLLLVGGLLLYDHLPRPESGALVIPLLLMELGAACLALAIYFQIAGLSAFRTDINPLTGRPLSEDESLNPQTESESTGGW